MILEQIEKYGAYVEAWIAGGYKMKVVEISPEDFQKMIIEIKELKVQIEKLENANKFLNDEILKYNKEFVHEK